ncbi:hypothetical protein HPB48_004141 [Haemaphysalis longicornis]|uniref:Speckle-type POZ protein n=1 Tax=Haemaphysalis longicornis TaxID=44386 RepID=A0A9J6FNP1_HAELO|nr:hypothetical protein HPB48_004141 [Haemaphysalis longicornis]
MSVPDSGCRTETKITDFTYTWTIRGFNFSEYEAGERVESPIFSSGAYEDVKWHLEIYPSGLDEDCGDYVSLFLRLDKSNSNEARAQASASIVTANGEATNTRSSGRPHLLLVGESWGWLKFVSKKALVKPTSKLLCNGSLIILCEVSVSVGAPDVVWERNTGSEVNVPSCHLSVDFNRLFESAPFGDVVFKLGDFELRAHKAILVTRSPVFASMFEHEMVESIQNKVRITDIDHEVFREMLRFVYTGEAPEIDKFPMELLVAADKYALDRLKAMCEKVVSSNISEANAAEVLAFADMHSANQLKTQAVRYICDHAWAVKKTAGWNNMVSSNPALALEVSMELFTRAPSTMGPPAKRMKK